MGVTKRRFSDGGCSPRGGASSGKVNELENTMARTLIHSLSAREVAEGGFYFRSSADESGACSALDGYE